MVLKGERKKRFVIFLCLSVRLMQVKNVETFFNSLQRRNPHIWMFVGGTRNIYLNRGTLECLSVSMGGNILNVLILLADVCLGVPTGIFYPSLMDSQYVV